MYFLVLMIFMCGKDQKDFTVLDGIGLLYYLEEGFTGYILFSRNMEIITECQ